jgi:hypothetical protein
VETSREEQLLSNGTGFPRNPSPRVAGARGSANRWRNCGSSSRSGLRLVSGIPIEKECDFRRRYFEALSGTVSWSLATQSMAFTARGQQKDGAEDPYRDRPLPGTSLLSGGAIVNFTRHSSVGRYISTNVSPAPNDPGRSSTGAHYDLTPEGWDGSIVHQLIPSGDAGGDGIIYLEARIRRVES